MFDGVVDEVALLAIQEQVKDMDGGLSPGAR
jgi:hypothetical protein